MNIAPYLSLTGLVLDVFGFSLIGWHLLKYPDKRFIYGGGDKEATRDKLGFISVILGFVLQAIAQAMKSWSPPGDPVEEQKLPVETFNDFISSIPGGTAFWSAILGAIVGGLIAYFIQVKALREGRKQRAEDREQVQKALGHSLLFKMIRIHTNCYGMHRHIEGCFEEAEKRGIKGEYWQFVQPLINPPEIVHFSSDEMGMLLSLNDDDTFNLTVSLDTIHNSLITVIKELNTQRGELTERLPAGDSAEGDVVSGSLDKQQMMTLRPRMINLNSLIDVLRVRAKKGFEDSGKALDGAHRVLRDKLGLTIKLKSLVEGLSKPTS